MNSVIDVAVTPQQLVAGRESELVIQLTNVGSGTCSNIILKLELPLQILLLRGNDRVEVPRLKAGETVTRSVRVRARDVGTWIVNSTNFSYRDCYGTSNRVSDFLVRLTVVPAVSVVAPDPEFVVDVASAELPYNEWGTLHGSVTNTGRIALRGLVVSVLGPITVDPRNIKRELGTLSPGQRTDFSFFVRARESGAQVPLHLDTVFTDDAGRAHRYDQPVAVRVSRMSTESVNTQHGKVASKPAKILYLAANPTDTEHIQLDQEMRQINETIRLGEWRENIELSFRTAVRFKDISQALLDVSPRIVHFSGHGTPDGSLYGVNEVGRSRLISPETLASVFKLMADSVECVIVNACHSERLARAVVQHIDYVVGMRDKIGDQAAIAFSVGFYQALAARRSIEDAFDLGCAHLEDRSRQLPGQRIPLLLKKEC